MQTEDLLFVVFGILCLQDRIGLGIIRHTIV